MSSAGCSARLKGWRSKSGRRVRAQGSCGKSARSRRPRIDGFDEEAVMMWEESDQLEEKDAVGRKLRGLTSKGRRRG